MNNRSREEELRRQYLRQVLQTPPKRRHTFVTYENISFTGLLMTIILLSGIGGIIYIIQSILGLSLL